MAGLTMYDWQKDIINILKTEPDKRTIHWYYDLQGNIGKTTFAKYLTLNFGAVPLGGKAADCRNGIVQYAKTNKGNTPEVVVVNIPRSFKKKYVSYEAFENIKDMYFFSGKYEGGVICGNCPHLFIFANNEPNYTKLSNDRWNVVDITPKEYYDNLSTDEDVDELDVMADEIDKYYNQQYKQPT